MMVKTNRGGDTMTSLLSVGIVAVIIIILVVLLFTTNDKEE
jgi:hypothetical protein